MSYPYTFFIHGIQPEPWMAPEGSIGRRKGGLFVQYHSPAAMADYKAALAEAFVARYGKPVEDPNFPPVNRVQFFFCREIIKYETPTGKIGTGHVADATNLQKSTEDALQKILYDNDRDNVYVSSAIIAQAVGVQPHIMIVADRIENMQAEFDWAYRAIASDDNQNTAWSAAGNFVQVDDDVDF